MITLLQTGLELTYLKNTDYFQERLNNKKAPFQELFYSLYVSGERFAEVSLELFAEVFRSVSDVLGCFCGGEILNSVGIDVLQRFVNDEWHDGQF